jgi:hypothetical protein
MPETTLVTDHRPSFVFVNYLFSLYVKHGVACNDKVYTRYPRLSRYFCPDIS